MRSTNTHKKSHWLSVNLSWNCEAAKEKVKMTIMLPALDLGVWKLRRFDFSPNGGFSELHSAEVATWNCWNRTRKYYVREL